MSNKLIDNKELMKEYNFEKNKNIDLNNITCGSEKKIWWKCDKGHEWESNIYNRAHGKNSCPFCTNRKVLAGFNDLDTTFPTISKQWNYLKNGDLKPTQVTYGSSKKVWWKCDNGHEWITSINNRTRGRNCPYCSQDTQTSFPEQAIYYYAMKIFKEVFNRYKDKYEIDVFIKDINTGIEYDGNYFHDNTNSKRNEKKKENYFKNKGITIYRIKENNKSKLKENNNLYLYYDYDNGKNLTEVIKKLFKNLNVDNLDIDVERDYIDIQRQYISSIKEKSILSIKPQLCKEWNYNKNKNITPDMISYSSAKKVWWTCSNCKKDYMSSVYSRYNGTNCPYCTNRVLIIGVNDLATTNPNLAKEWNFNKNILKPVDVVAGGKNKVWWICSKCGYEWQAALFARNNGSGCPVCSNRILVSGKNDLATTNPELLKEWDYEKNNLLPSEVIAGSRDIIWWKCEKNHSYQKRLFDKKNGGNCPYCCNRKRLIGYNDLATTNPELLNEWNYKKNIHISPNDVSSGSGKKVWWICSKCSYEWQAQIKNRIHGTGCPKCSRKKKR